MKKLLMLAAFSAALFAAVQFSPLKVSAAKADAAPKFLQLLYANDGGSTGTYTFSAYNQVAAALCDIPVCYKTAASGTVTVDCTKDMIAPSYPHSRTTITTDGDAGAQYGFPANYSQIQNVRVPKEPMIEVDMAGDKSIAFFAMDAGNPNCRLYGVYYNPTHVTPNVRTEQLVQ